MEKRVHRPVIFDLEFTAWDGSLQSGWTRSGEFREVVQIGAVKLAADSLKPVDEFEILILPRLNPVLSGFFTGLTGIGNEEVARRGVDFITAYRAFLDFAAGRRCGHMAATTSCLPPIFDSMGGAGILRFRTIPMPFCGSLNRAWTCAANMPVMSRKPPEPHSPAASTMRSMMRVALWPVSGRWSQKARPTRFAN
jgi:inhibitor of KinA sporulation pathway (predicted exonuclease)